MIKIISIKIIFKDSSNRLFFNNSLSVISFYEYIKILVSIFRNLGYSPITILRQVSF